MYLLQMFDAYGNHAREGLEVQFNVDGFCFQDHNGLKRKVKYFVGYFIAIIIILTDKCGLLKFKRSIVLA